MLVALLVCLSLLWLLYKKYTAVYSLWKERGIQFEPGTFPFGSRSELILYTGYPGYVFDQMYRKHSNVPYFGFYNFRTPYLVIRDVELIKNVLTTDFSSFRDRRHYKLSNAVGLTSHLFNLDGQRWRALRTKLSPTFTTGKLKGMYKIFIDCAEDLNKYLLSKLDSVVDIKDIAGRFSTDIICSCAFGLDVGTIHNSDNPLRKAGKAIVDMPLMFRIKSSLLRGFPAHTDFIERSFCNGDGANFFIGVIKQSVEQREKYNIKRNDFLDLLIQLRDSNEELKDGQDFDEKKSDPVEMTIELMTAQAHVFFVAGFETASSVQSFCLYELALHPEMQDRLRKEIDSTISKHKDLTYQAIMEMEYLDMVVSETMRKYPTLSHLTRRCTKTYTTPAGHKIEKGDNILIPNWSLHHDPAHFPEPEKFDPERFSPKNKDNVKPYTYLPFGEGPRICIGMKFGQLASKMGIITIIRKLKVEPCEETPIPIIHGPHIITSPTIKPIKLRLSQLPSDL